MAKPERRDRAKERYWRGLLRQWRRSGLTGRDFCAEHGLSEPSFYAWRREIARRDQERSTAAGPAAVTATPIPTERILPTTRPTHEAAPVFVKLALARDAADEATTDETAPPAIEVVVAGRRVVRVRRGFDADLLRQLVRLLEEPTC